MTNGSGPLTFLGVKTLVCSLTPSRMAIIASVFVNSLTTGGGAWA